MSFQMLCQGCNTRVGLPPGASGRFRCPSCKSLLDPSRPRQQYAAAPTRAVITAKRRTGYHIPAGPPSYGTWAFRFACGVVAIFAGILMSLIALPYGIKQAKHVAASVSGPGGFNLPTSLHDAIAPGPKSPSRAYNSRDELSPDIFIIDVHSVPNEQSRLDELRAVLPSDLRYEMDTSVGSHCYIRFDAPEAEVCLRMGLIRMSVSRRNSRGQIPFDQLVSPFGTRGSR